MINVLFETTPFWALGIYGRTLKAPIPQYTAVYSGIYGRILNYNCNYEVKAQSVSRVKAR